jgi:hypothetical protein
VDAVGRPISQRTVSGEPKAQEPTRFPWRNNRASDVESRGHREVDHELGDDRRFRATGLASDAGCLTEVFKTDLHRQMAMYRTVIRVKLGSMNLNRDS